MNAESRARPWAWLALGVAWCGAHLLAGGPHLGWIWGLGYLGFLPGPAWWVWVALALATLAFAAMRLQSSAGLAHRPPGRSSARRDAGVKPVPAFPPVVLASVAAGAGVLFWLLRGRTHYLGDGNNRLLHGGDPRGVYKAPLDLLVNFHWSGALGKFAGGGLEQGQALVSVLSGVAAILFLPELLRASGIPAGARRWGAAVLLLSGWALLFFGYLEAYPVYLTALLGFLWLAVRLRRAGPWALALVPAWLVLAGLHSQGLLMLPAMVFGTALGVGRGKRPGAGLLAAIGGIGLALAAVRTPLLGLADHSFGLFGFLWDAFMHSSRSLAGSTQVWNGFALGRANELLLVGGASLLLIPFALGREGKSKVSGDEEEFRSSRVFLALAALGGLGALLYRGEVGAARDWDLIAPSLVPAQLWLVARAIRLMDRPWRSVILPATAALSLAHTAPWVWIQFDADAGSDFAASLASRGPEVLQLIPHDRVELGESLARRELFSQAAAVLEGMDPRDPAAPKLRRAAGRLRVRSRQYAGAARDYEMAYRAGYRGVGLQGLAVVFALSPQFHMEDSTLESEARLLARVDSAGIGRRWEAVMALTGEGLRIAADEPLFHRRRAYALLMQGYGDDAVASARRGIEADSGDAGGWEALAVVLEGLDRPSEAARARRRSILLGDPAGGP